jgi:hypothetical protein
MDQDVEPPHERKGIGQEAGHDDGPVQAQRGDPSAHARLALGVGKRADQGDAHAGHGGADRGHRLDEQARVLSPVEVAHHPHERATAEVRERDRGLGLRRDPRHVHAVVDHAGAGIMAEAADGAPGQLERVRRGRDDMPGATQPVLAVRPRAPVARVDVHHLRDARDLPRQVTEREGREGRRVEQVRLARERREPQDVGEHERAREPAPACETRHDGGAFRGDPDLVQQRMQRREGEAERPAVGRCRIVEDAQRTQHAGVLRMREGDERRPHHVLSVPRRSGSNGPPLCISVRNPARAAASGAM